MVGTIMDRDVEMVPCETLELNVPAQAEIVVEGRVNLEDRFKVGEVTSPSMYHLPHYENLPEVEITAITMRGGPADLSQPPDLPRHRPSAAAAALSRGGALQPAQRDRPRRQGRALPDLGRGALLHPAVRLSARGHGQRRADAGDGRALAQHQAGGRGVARHQSRRRPATSITPSRRAAIPRATSIVVPNTRGSPYDPSARPLEGQHPWRIVGKMGIDATVKSRHDPADFERAWPPQLGQGETGGLSVNGATAHDRRTVMDAIAPPKPKVLFEAEPFIPYMREEDFDSAAQAGGRALQEAHGLPAECAQALRLSAGDRRDAVEAQQQHHARSDLDARPVAQAQARGGRLRRSTAAPIARRTAARC